MFIDVSESPLVTRVSTPVDGGTTPSKPSDNFQKHCK